MSDFSSVSQDFKFFVLSDADTSMGLGHTSHLDQLGDPSLQQLEHDTAQAKTILTSLENCVGSTV